MNTSLFSKPPTVLISGGTSGIGRATASAFAREGSRVAVTYARDEQAAEELVGEVRRAGGNLLAFRGDATQADAVRDTVAQVRSALGDIDVLVNNVGGVIKRVPFVDCDESLWDTVIAFNLKSAFLFTREVLPQMIARRYGRIVNVSAFAARNGGAGNGSIPYGAAKAGLEALTIGLARDYADTGVRINAVQLGLVDTPLHAHTDYDPTYGSALDFMNKVGRLTPMHRAAQPEEVATAIVYLASDQASYITGAILSVTGGL